MLKTKYKFVFFFLIYVISSFAQDSKKVVAIDSLFREDQFYVSVSYNLVQNRPAGFKQFSFSQGFTFGFLRDFPLTKNRHWAIAPGFGYNYNNIKQFINSSDIMIEGSEAVAVSENVRTTIVSHLVDFPLELRWRNATPESHKFWRIYLGVKASYVFNAQIKLESSQGNEKRNIRDNLNEWQYGMYLGMGYNTWNPYVYYGLNPLFKDGSKLSNLNFGFIFYIL
ncbi:porin family protein [Flavobacterium chuncheonense]|uniref:Porin family protein n=1 Tax=Flavobacterium chuncheonense TaxID=2026653 RepID=A0ABW5YMX3_9FLAO